MLYQAAGNLASAYIPSYTRTLTEVFPYVYVLNEAPTWQSPYANTYVVAASATPIDMAGSTRSSGPGAATAGPLVNIMPPDVMQEWLQSHHGRSC